MGKLLAVVVVVVALAAIVGLALWPGTVIGVSNGALGESVAREQDDPEAADCSGEDDLRQCRTKDASLEVTVDRYGCWDVKPPKDGGGGRSGRGRGAVPVDLSGCVTVLDLIGIG